jgi:hypothetical protein
MSGVPNYLPSTIETVDGAFLDYVEGLNLFCNTINGWDKVPVIWSSAERAYQIKNNREIRDANGSLIPPIISIERVSTTKDVNKKGNFQANLSPKNDRYVYTKVLNQDKTSNFANADTLKTKGQINFITSKKNEKIVYKFVSIPIPVYITVEYKINIITNYQSQMNEIIQPFMSRVAQSYFVIKKDDHRYECFMDQNFQQDSIADLAENERKYKSSITVKVLGYLIGEGDNQEKPQTIEQENAVEVKFPKESLTFIGEEDKRIQKKRSTNEAVQVSSGILTKKKFIVGDGVNSTYTVKHNFNSRDIIVLVRENFNNYDQVEVSIDYGDLNHIDLDFGDVVSATDQYSVVIIG